MVGFYIYKGEKKNNDFIKEKLENYNQPIARTYGNTQYTLDEKVTNFTQEGQKTSINFSFDVKQPTNYQGSIIYNDMSVNAHIRIISNSKNYYLFDCSDGRYLNYVVNKISEIIYGTIDGIICCNLDDSLIRSVKEEDRRSQGVMWVEDVTQKDRAIGLFGNLETLDGDVLDESEYNTRLKDKTIKATNFISFSTGRSIWISGKKNKVTVQGGNYTEVEDYFINIILPKL